jgi:hypothetical protein
MQFARSGLDGASFLYRVSIVMMVAAHHGIVEFFKQHAMLLCILLFLLRG